MAASIREIFKANLRRILAEKDINQRKLAEALGVTPEQVTRWKSGVSFPETHQIDDLVKALKIHPEELFLDPGRIKLTADKELESAVIDGIKQLLRSVGYEVVKRKPH